MWRSGLYSLLSAQLAHTLAPSLQSPYSIPKLVVEKQAPMKFPLHQKNLPCRTTEPDQGWSGPQWPVYTALDLHQCHSSARKPKRAHMSQCSLVYASLNQTDVGLHCTIVGRKISQDIIHHPPSSETHVPSGWTLLIRLRENQKQVKETRSTSNCVET